MCLFWRSSMCVFCHSLLPSAVADVSLISLRKFSIPFFSQVPAFWSLFQEVVDSADKISRLNKAK